MTEQELFEFLKENYLPDLKMSDEPMSHWDCYSAKYYYDIELKCRRAHYDDLLIEKMKYDNLLNRSKRFGTIPVYINSTPVGIYVFKLNEVDISWETKKMPATTDFTRKEKVDKVVGFLNLTKAKKLNANPRSEGW
jgi:Holliday junction resolvase